MTMTSTKKERSLALVAFCQNITVLGPSSIMVYELWTSYAGYANNEREVNLWKHEAIKFVYHLDRWDADNFV